MILVATVVTIMAMVGGGSKACAERKAIGAVEAAEKDQQQQQEQEQQVF